MPNAERGRTNDSAPQDCFTGARVRQRDILERLDSPRAVAFREHREDQRIDIMRARGVGRTDAQAAPEVDDRSAFTERGDVEQLVLEGGIAIDRIVDRLV